VLYFRIAMFGAPDSLHAIMPMSMENIETNLKIGSRTMSGYM